MTLDDEFRILVGGYFGIVEMDEYSLKEYILNDIEKYIKNFIEENSYYQFDFEEAKSLNDTLTLKRKLQDSLLTLRKINGPFELEHMIKLRLQELKKNE